MRIVDRVRRVLWGSLYDEARRGSTLSPSIAGFSSGRDEYLLVLRRAEEALSRVIVPGYDYDLMSSGAVKRMRISYDKKTMYIIIDYMGSDPGCNFCRFINWQVWRRILADAEAKVREATGVDNVVFIDLSTRAIIDYRGEEPLREGAK